MTLAHSYFITYFVLIVVSLWGRHTTVGNKTYSFYEEKRANGESDWVKGERRTEKGEGPQEGRDNEQKYTRAGRKRSRKGVEQCSSRIVRKENISPPKSISTKRIRFQESSVLSSCPFTHIPPPLLLCLSHCLLLMFSRWSESQTLLRSLTSRINQPLSDFCLLFKENRQ